MSDASVNQPVNKTTQPKRPSPQNLLRPPFSQFPSYTFLFAPPTDYEVWWVGVQLPQRG